MFTFNQTIRSQMKSTQNLKLSNNMSQTRLIPIQRREKIKELLVLKFMKKYGIKDSELNIEKEMDKFLKKEQITDHDLKKFDYHINNLISERRSCDDLHQNLNSNLNNVHSSQELNPRQGLNPVKKTYDSSELNPNHPNNDNISVRSKFSKMSGVSKFSLFSDLNDNRKEFKNQTYKDLRRNLDEGKSFDTNTLPINIQGDNWVEINKYNQKVFEKEKIDSKIKEMEIKQRIKNTLDEQVKEKHIRRSMEFQRNRIFDDIVLQHVDNMNNLEKEREMEIKQKILREKDSRDRQLEDEIKRKKIEAYKTKRYERDLGILNNLNFL